MSSGIGNILIGNSALMTDLRRSIGKVSRTDMTVLINGESGTGKELVARLIHDGSSRAGEPYIAINCGSFPASLIETELYGHERGAFTGADSLRKGKFELAHRGTIFLDEIGELSVEAQVKLLRVLQNKEIYRIGGQHPIQIDFRLIAATNRNLEGMIKAGKFREDLFYRLNVCVIETPPLRYRVQDIPVLAHHFLLDFARQAERVVKGISKEVLDLFDKYAWPGNVRQLQNVIQRAVFIGEGEWIELADLPFDLFQKLIVSNISFGNYHRAMNAASREIIRHALAVAKGNGEKAATLLELHRRTLHRLARKHGLDKENNSL